MISKRFTPIYIHKKLHSSLYIILISTAADIVDFAEYSNDHEIVNHYGVDLIWGIFNIFIIVFSSFFKKNFLKSIHILFILVFVTFNSENMDKAVPIKLFKLLINHVHFSKMIEQRSIIRQSFGPYELIFLKTFSLVNGSIYVSLFWNDVTR